MSVAAAAAIGAMVDVVLMRGGRHMHARFHDRLPAASAFGLGLLRVDRRMRMAGMRLRARRRERDQRQRLPSAAIMPSNRDSTIMARFYTEAPVTANYRLPGGMEPRCGSRDS